MKILMLATNYDAPVGGGGQKSLKVLVEALSLAGHEVVIGALAHDVVGVKFVDGIKVWYLPTRNIFRPVDSVKRSTINRLTYHSLDIYNIPAAHDIKRLCEAESPDIVHTHVITGLSVSIWAAIKNLNLPLVHTLRDQYLLCARSTLFKKGSACVTRCGDCRLFRLGHRRWSNMPDAVIGISNFILKSHRDNNYFSKVKKMDVIYNARRSDELGVLESNSVSDDSIGTTFGFIGSLTKSKGVEYLINSFLKISALETRLIIAGTGDGIYDKYLRETYCNNRIKFIGRVKQRDFFNLVDVVIVPSLWDEPLGMVVAEAFAFGKPVIGSNKGGIVEMIDHSVNGFLFDSTLDYDLIRYMEILLDSKIRSKIGLNALESSRKFLDLRRYADEHISIYNLIVTR